MGLVETVGADAPRFDHSYSPTTGAITSLGLLIEEARTNLLLQSNQFNTTWTNGDTSETAAAGIAPDGTNTAWELKDTLDATPTIHSLGQTVSFTSGVTYTFTCWMKAGTLTQGGLALPSTAFTSVLGCRVDLLTGEVLTSSSGLSTSTTLYANGWVRVTSVATATATSSNTSFIRIVNNANSYIGTGNGTILIWGAQLEAGAFPTSYIPTTSATVTRAADSASITGTNFLRWYNQTEGTISWSGRVTSREVQSQNPVRITDGSSTRGIGFQFDTRTGNIASIFATRAVVSGFAVATNPAAINLSSSFKFTGAYKVNDYLGASFDGGTAVTSTNLTSVFGTENRMDIGSASVISGASAKFNGIITCFAYYPRRLSNTQLQALTK